MTEYLVINSGSSSLKFAVYRVRDLKSLSQGIIEEIGGSSSLKYTTKQSDTLETKCKVKDHKEGVSLILDLLQNKHQLTKDSEAKAVIRSCDDIAAVGHRIVHGGESFHEAVLLSDEVLKQVEAVSELAPLHNPPSLKGIQVCKELLGNHPQVLVFDTAFHHTMPPHVYMYGIPYEYYEKKHIRKYGFHGTSHLYLSKTAIQHLNLAESRIITLHLGNGSSACAVKNGKSVDTSMGLTPLEGLMMGTRSGDLDPAVVFHMRPKNASKKEIMEVEQQLNKKSGLAGIAGVSDMREVHKKIDESSGEERDRAKLAFDMFCYGILKYVGSYFVTLEGLDALVFSGGIGEHDNRMRSQVCGGLRCLGIEIDEEKNSNANTKQLVEIQSAQSKVKVFVIPTDEEGEIARQMKELLQRNSKL